MDVVVERGLAFTRQPGDNLKPGPGWPGWRETTGPGGMADYERQ